MKQEQEKIVPYEALESLGINKKDLKGADIDALLAGNKTDLMKFSVEDTPERRNVLGREKVDFLSDNGKLYFEGKIQLQKYMTVDNTDDNKKILKGANIDFDELKGNKLKFDASAMRKLAIGVVVLISPITALALVLVPKRNEIKNDAGLTDKDIKALKMGEVVGRTNDKKEKILLQLDKETNNLVSVRAKDISIPDKVAGQEITPIQKEQLKNGQEIQVKDSTGQTVFAKIDLNEKTGLSLKDENGQKIAITAEQKQREAYDRNNPHIVGTVQTDQNRNEYVQSMQNAKLEKYNLKNDFTAAHGVDNPKNLDAYLPTDKERLQHIANNGLEGIKDIHSTNIKLRDEFFEKHNLSKEVKRVDEISKLSPEEYNKQGKGLNKEMDSLSNSLKSKASGELSGFVRENSVKNEVKQETISFKMKM